MAKHTPGPWSFEKARAGSIWAIKAGAVWVADIVRWATTDPEAQAEREANARLIAAAPELLEALEDFVSAYEIDEGANGRTVAARALISKAKGEQV